METALSEAHDPPGSTSLSSTEHAPRYFYPNIFIQIFSSKYFPCSVRSSLPFYLVGSFWSFSVVFGLFRFYLAPFSNCWYFLVLFGSVQFCWYVLVLLQYLCYFEIYECSYSTQLNVIIVTGRNVPMSLDIVDFNQICHLFLFLLAGQSNAHLDSWIQSIPHLTLHPEQVSLKCV